MMYQKTKYHSLMKGILCLAVCVGFCFAGNYAFAQGLEEAAGGVTTALQSVAKLLGGMAYVIGIVFAIIGIMKFKEWKDGGGKTKIGTPIVIIFVAVGMLFLPTLIKMSAQTLGITGPTVEAGTAIKIQ